jgi:CheY-like chemotaxis protein
MLPPPAQPRANVLIVDDDAGVRDVCTSLLHDLGYQATGARDRDQALATLRSRAQGAASTLADDGAQVALALVDLELPGAQDGSLLRALRREQPGLRVLLMSGRPRSDLRRFLQTGADAVLEKPFRLGELDQSLDVALAAGLSADA